MKEGDTCDAITGANGINSTLLWTNNPNIDEGCSNIYVGEVLCVANSVLVPPVPSSGIPATSIPATAANPTSTPAPSSTPAPVNNAAASPSPSSDDGDDEDDDDLPFCDEL